MTNTEHPAYDAGFIIKIMELLGSFEENLIVASASGRILFASGNAKDLFQTDLTGRNLNEFIDDKSASILISEAAFGNSVTVHAECGDSRVFSLTMFPCAGYIVITAILSPEYKPKVTAPEYSPLADYNLRLSVTSLFSALSVLASPDITAEKRSRSIYTMNNHLYRILRLINNMSDISRNSLHKSHLSTKCLDISDFCEEIIKKIAPYCEKRGIKLNYEPLSTPAVMNFDPEKLERALLNILSNSLKHTKENDTVSVHLKKNGSKIMIRISDSGTGIPETELPYVFSRYASPASPDTLVKGGAGYGLAVTRAILEMHGGSVMLESTENEGTAVTLSIPVNLPQTSELNTAKTDPQGGFSPMLVEMSSVFDIQEYKI